MIPANTIEFVETAKRGQVMLGNPSRVLEKTPLLPPLTRAAMRVLWVIAALFVLAVALRLNGSSVACLKRSGWNDVVIADAPSGVLLSTPKVIRSDEWLIWTPSILSQARQNPAFPTDNPSLGPPKTPLLMSIPARDYTMFLRPQLWGYFLLPVEFGFAWNWDFKIFGLLAAMFLLFWKVSGGKLGLSLFGALSVLFSPLVQWWFSSPSMLPEMLTYWALAVGAALRIFAATSGSTFSAWQRTRAAIPGVLVLGVCFANMTWCCYPPFEIVLIHLGLFIVAGFVWQHRLLTPRGVLLGLASFALAALLVLPWVWECYDTMQIVAHTVYPGQRRCFGGGFPAVRLFSGLYGLALTEANTPGILSNVCEASSFYPLWLLPLGLGFCAFIAAACKAPAALRDWLRARALKVSLAMYLTGFSVFALAPFPHWFCNATLLSRTIEVRGMLGLGLAGLLLIVLNFASAPTARASWKTALPAGIAWSAGVLAFLLWQRSALLTPPISAPLLTPWRIAGLEGVAIFFGFVYLLAPGAWAQAALLAPFILTTALINPVCIGLPELLGSPALNEVRAIVQKEPRAQWACYNSLFGVELLKTAGARVVDGVRVIPDPSLIRKLDPQGRDNVAYNRYVHLIFEPARPPAEVSARLKNNVFCIIEISVPKLRELFPRVKFIVATGSSPDLEAAGFRLRQRWPEDHLWIYELAAGPPPGPMRDQPPFAPAS